MSQPGPVDGSSVALCLTGGGAAGAMFQIGALAALEDRVEEVAVRGFDVYVGTSSGACVATALAGGQEVQRIYRALLDPSDDYFPLERRHIMQMDLAEWRRTVTTAVRALSHGSRSVFGGAESRAGLWEELSRLYDSLPAGLFALDGFQAFFEQTLSRRGVSNRFSGLPRALRIIAHHLDTGEAAVFGSSEWEHVEVARACIASMAMPPLFSPVKIGDAHFFDPAPSQASHIDVAMDAGARRIVVINPLVPLRVSTVPTGHGIRRSLRDKGAMWVGNQANRIKVHHQLWRNVEQARQTRDARVLVIEPEPTDGILFLHNAASFAARRSVLEFAYLHTCRMIEQLEESGELDTLGMTFRPPPTET